MPSGMKLTSSAKTRSHYAANEAKPRTLPSSESMRREQLLHQVRRSILFKKQQGVRLTAVESHLAQNLSKLERHCFAPTVAETINNVLRALIRPALQGSLCATVLVAAFTNSSSAWLNVDEDVQAVELASEPDAEPVAAIADDTIINKLAVALATESTAPNAETQPKPETLSAIELPNLPPLPAPEVAIVKAAPPVELPKTMASLIQQRDSILAPDPRITDLRKRQGLIKFISGLIAAFRPSIQDCGLIARHIVEISAQENIDPLYVAAVISIESRFSSSAQSYAGAVGLMQLMPGTAKDVARARRSNAHTPNHLVDPRTNIKLGIDYLKFLERRYRSDRFLALAAYNWGPANVDQANQRRKRIPGSVRDYSRTIMGRLQNWRNHFTKASESAEALEQASLPVEGKRS